MDKIIHSAFDFFGYALPGSVLLISFFILDPNLNTSRDFLLFFDQLKFGAIVLIIIFGYLFGFALTPIGRYAYRKIGFAIWGYKIVDKTGIESISDKYVMVREITPSNFKYIELWNVLCGMSHNLAIVSISIFLLSIAKIFFQNPANPFFWATVSFYAVVFFFLFLYRAVVFSKWAADDINASIVTLKLQDKLQKK